MKLTAKLLPASPNIMPKKKNKRKAKKNRQEYCQGSWEIILNRGVANNMLFSFEISSTGIQQYTYIHILHWCWMLNQCVQWKDILIMLCIWLSVYRNVNVEYGIIFCRALLYPALLLIFIPVVTDSARCSLYLAPGDFVVFVYSLKLMLNNWA